MARSSFWSFRSIVGLAPHLRIHVEGGRRGVASGIAVGATAESSGSRQAKMGLRRYSRPFGDEGIGQICSEMIPFEVG